MSKTQVKKNLVKFLDNDTIRVDSEGFYVVIGCEHIPGNNKAMWEARLKMMKKYSKKIKGLIIAGDFMDFNSLSSHDKGKNSITSIDKEFNAGNKALDELGKVLSKDAIKIYLMGNHEDRHYRQLKNPDYVKSGAQNDPVARLSLKERGYHVIEDYNNGLIQLGEHLLIGHGFYYNQHCAKKHIDTFRKSFVFFHTHRIQSYIEGQTGGFNLGGGFDQTHDFFNYAPKATKNSWNNGFGLIYLDNESNYYVQQIIWYKDKFTLGFELFK
jgi:hypothetical protein